MTSGGQKNYRINLTVKGEDALSGPMQKAGGSIKRLKTDLDEVSRVLGNSQRTKGLQDFQKSLEKLSNLKLQNFNAAKAEAEINRYMKATRELLSLKKQERALDAQIKNLGDFKSAAGKEELRKLRNAKNEISSQMLRVRDSAGASVNKIGALGFDVSGFKGRAGLSPQNAMALKNMVAMEAKRNADAVDAEEKVAKSAIRRHEMEIRMERERKRREKEAREERSREERRAKEERQRSERAAREQRQRDERERARTEKRAADARKEEAARIRREERDAASRVRREEREKRLQAKAFRDQENTAYQKVQAFAELGRFGAGMSGGINRGLVEGMSVERAMSRVNAKLILPEIDPEKNPAAFKALSRKIRADAFDVARETGARPQDVLLGYEELAKTGFQSKDIDKPIVRNLTQSAITGDMPIGDMVKLTAGVVQGFKMPIKESMIPVSNTLSSVADLTQIDLTDLAYTFKYIAPYAQQAGASFKQVAAFAALMGKGGIKGEMAGTSLVNFVQDMASPTSRGRQVLETPMSQGGLGIKTRDENGNVRDYTQILREIAVAMDKRNLGSGERLEVAEKLVGRHGGAGFLQLLSTVNEQIKVTIDGQEKMVNHFDYIVSEIERSQKTDMIARKARVMTDDMQGSVDRLKASASGFSGVVQGEMSDPLQKLIDLLGEATTGISSFADENETFAKALGIGGAAASTGSKLLESGADLVTLLAGWKILKNPGGLRALFGMGEKAAATGGRAAALGSRAATFGRFGLYGAAAGTGFYLGNKLYDATMVPSPLDSIRAQKERELAARRSEGADFINSQTIDMDRRSQSQTNTSTSKTAVVNNTFNLYGVKETDQKVVDEIDKKIKGSLIEGGFGGLHD